MEAEARIQEDSNKMTDGSILDGLLAIGVILGVFAMFYMAWRQQGILETVNEIKEAFQDKAEDVKDAMVYK